MATPMPDSTAGAATHSYALSPFDIERQGSRGSLTGPGT
jgi:hypothetical protein